MSDIRKRCRYHVEYEDGDGEDLALRSIKSMLMHVSGATSGV